MNPRVHEPGQCTDSSYGADCNGIASYGPDPFAWEIYNDDSPVWLCEGERYGRAMDI